MLVIIRTRAGAYRRIFADIWAGDMAADGSTNALNTISVQSRGTGFTPGTYKQNVPNSVGAAGEIEYTVGSNGQIASAKVIKKGAAFATTSNITLTITGGTTNGSIRVTVSSQALLPVIAMRGGLPNFPVNILGGKEAFIERLVNASEKSGRAGNNIITIKEDW